MWTGVCVSASEQKSYYRIIIVGKFSWDSFNWMGMVIFASIHFVSMRYSKHTYVFVAEISCRPWSFPTIITNILPHITRYTICIVYIYMTTLFLLINKLQKLARQLQRKKEGRDKEKGDLLFLCLFLLSFFVPPIRHVFRTKEQKKESLG